MNKHGYKWIRIAKRRRIYERDNYHCVWCGCEVAEKVNITLDHFVPRTSGGSNDASNLVTACRACNDHRGERDPEAWASEEMLLRAKQQMSILC